MRKYVRRRVEGKNHPAAFSEAFGFSVERRRRWMPNEKRSLEVVSGPKVLHLAKLVYNV